MQRQVEAWGRFGGGSMNLEFDFELNVPHATHKALGLGRRISKGLRPHAADPNPRRKDPYKIDASTCNQNVAFEESHFSFTFASNGVPLGSIGSIKEATKGPKELLWGPPEVPR